MDGVTCLLHMIKTQEEEEVKSDSKKGGGSTVLSVEEKPASLRVGYLGHPVTADGVSKKWRINRNII